MNMALISIKTNETKLSNVEADKRASPFISQRKKKKPKHTEGNAGKIRETKKNINQKL